MDLDELERVITKFWEGIFRKGKRPIQPVEMARALVREMATQRRVSVSRVYAPNIFTISLGKTDFETSTPLQDALSQELAEYVKNKSSEKEYSLIGRPQVGFIEDESLDTGEIAVKSAFSSDYQQEVQAPHQLPNKIDHTMIFDKMEVKQGNGAVGKNYFLVIISGPEQGKRISLHGEEGFYIGRKSTNQLVLSDINASREHAMLEWRGETLYLVDLGSRNGTYVDGMRMEECPMEPGDQFKIGENLFRVEGG